ARFPARLAPSRASAPAWAAGQLGRPWRLGAGARAGQRGNLDRGADRHRHLVDAPQVVSGALAARPPAPTVSAPSAAGTGTLTSSPAVNARAGRGPSLTRTRAGPARSRAAAAASMLAPGER